MDIDELTIFGRYNLKDDKVTSAFLQVINYGRPSENLDFLRFITVLMAYKAL